MCDLATRSLEELEECRHLAHAAMAALYSVEGTVPRPLEGVARTLHRLRAHIDEHYLRRLGIPGGAPDELRCDELDERAALSRRLAACEVELQRLRQVERHVRELGSQLGPDGWPTETQPGLLDAAIAVERLERLVERALEQWVAESARLMAYFEAGR